MIRLARSRRLRTFMQSNPLAARLARRYCAGPNRTELLRRIEQLACKGLSASIYYLGEYVDSPDLIEQNLREIREALQAFHAPAPAVFFSIDPTQIGYSISEELGRANAMRIAMQTEACSGVRFLMLDMEDTSYVDPTIALYHALREKEIPVAITLQAYLRRTEADLERLIALGARIRLVKGAFVAGKQVAWTKRREIDDAYERFARRALSEEAKAAGVYPILATHDARILAALRPVLRANRWHPGEYEIEMLLGVREPLQLALAREGHPVRVYVPFGADWWAYTARRVGENPANTYFVLQSFWGR